jgi:hypothetical protein
MCIPMFRTTTATVARAGSAIDAGRVSPAVARAAPASPAASRASADWEGEEAEEGVRGCRSGAEGALTVTGAGAPDE